MSKFVKKMMFAHQLDFEEGRFEMLGVRGVILPAFTVTRLMEQAYEEVGEDAFDILFQVGVDHGRMAIEDVGEEHSMSKNEFMKKMVESGNVMGVGKMSLEEFDPADGEAAVTLQDSPFAEQFMDSGTFQNLDRPVDDLIRGVLHGIFADIFDTETVTVEETKCAFQGDGMCEFRPSRD
ncbi:MAG: V4R domain-containing protein [Candidatus Nanohaloarchaea archaeon]